MSGAPGSPKRVYPSPLRLTGWKRVLPLRIEQRDGVRIVRILWKNFVGLLAASLVCFYVMLVVGAWAFLNFQRGVTETRFIDLLMPQRWPIQRVRIGDHQIAVARHQLETGEARDAFISLRSGVAKSPANLEGRLLLAKLLVAAHRNDLAEDCLLAGLPFAFRDLAYLRETFGFLLEQQHDDAVRTHARRLLSDPQLSPDAASLVALAAASASYFRGNYDEADDFIESHRLDLTYDGRLLSAQVDWERGYRELALARLRALSDEYPGNDSARAQLANWLRDLGRSDEFRRESLLRQIALPGSPAPRIELLRALRQENSSLVPAEVDAILRDSSGDEKLLLALADFAAETADVDLARRVYERCRTLNRGWEAAAFLQVEALIAAQRYREALDLTRTLLDANRDWSKRYYALFNSLQAVAYYGLGDASSAQLYLSNFLGQADLRADNLLAVAQRFADVGARPEARETLAHAVMADPLNQAALTRLIQLDLDLNQIDALPPHLRQLLTMRRPSPVVLRAALAKLGSDLFLFSRERDATLAALQGAVAAVPAVSSATP